LSQIYVNGLFVINVLKLYLDSGLLVNSYNDKEVYQQTTYKFLMKNFPLNLIKRNIAAIIILIGGSSGI